MKKFLPFLFPLIALLIVIFLSVRWYNSKTHRGDGKIPDLAEDVKVEDLTAAQAGQMKAGNAKDMKTLEMTGSGEVKGQVRYEVLDGKVLFSVYANLPDPTPAFYQVWIKQVDSDAKKQAFVLENTKGGFTGSASVNENMLPFEVLITKQTKSDEPMGDVILRTIVNK